MDKGKINLLNIKLYLEYYKKDITDKYSKLIENIVLDKDVLNILNENIYITTLDKYYKLQRKNNNLNKGIDELIKWHEKDIEERNKRLIFFETYKDERMQELNNQAIFDDKQFIEKLKKLKGE